MSEALLTWSNLFPAVAEISLVSAICLILLVEVFAGERRRGLTPTLTLLALAVCAALTLRYLDGLPVPEVARHLDRTLHATEALLARARAAFRRIYEAQEGSR